MNITAETLARLYLLNVTEPPVSAVQGFIAAHGVVEAVARIRGRAAPPAVLAEIIRSEVTVDHDLAVIRSGAARLVTPEDRDWPQHLFRGLTEHGFGSPLGLWIRGEARLPDLIRSAVAVAGCRAATAYGGFVAAELGFNLAQADTTVVTGGALGIDTEATRGAVAGEGPVLVVLPCGADVLYPLSNDRLIGGVLDHGGMVISEYRPGTTPTRARFLSRHRLVAALASTTVVVEAADRGVSLRTARVARTLGRPVYSVPGPITSSQSNGTNELLRTGRATAFTSTSIDDLVRSRGLQ